MTNYKPEQEKQETSAYLDREARRDENAEASERDLVQNENAFTQQQERITSNIEGILAKQPKKVTSIRKAAAPVAAPPQEVAQAPAETKPAKTAAATQTAENSGGNEWQYTDYFNKALSIHENEAKRYHDNYRESVSRWEDARRAVLEREKSLYKADERAVKRKQTEAALKTLFASIGTLFGGFTDGKVLDYRNDIYSTQAQSEALRQAENAKETADRTKWMEQLNNIDKAYPKYEYNPAIKAMGNIYLEYGKMNWNAAQAYEKAKQYAGEKDKDRKNALKIAGIRAASSGSKEKYIQIPEYGTNNTAIIRINKEMDNVVGLQSILVKINEKIKLTKEEENEIRDIKLQYGMFDNANKIRAEIGYLTGKYKVASDIVKGFGESSKTAEGFK